MPFYVYLTGLLPVCSASSWLLWITSIENREKLRQQRCCRDWRCVPFLPVLGSMNKGQVPGQLAGVFFASNRGAGLCLRTTRSSRRKLGARFPLETFFHVLLGLNLSFVLLVWTKVSHFPASHRCFRHTAKSLRERVALGNVFPILWMFCFSLCLWFFC